MGGVRAAERAVLASTKTDNEKWQSKRSDIQRHGEDSDQQYAR